MNFQKTIEHPYNIVFISTSETFEDYKTELYNLTLGKQQEDMASIMDITLKHYTNKEIGADEIVSILDLIKMVTYEFDSCSVFFYGEEQHSESLVDLIKTNPKFLNETTEVKICTTLGYVKIH